jgi:hypothetical protein
MTKCIDVEGEYHFILQCEKYIDVRRIMIKLKHHGDIPIKFPGISFPYSYGTKKN